MATRLRKTIVQIAPFPSELGWMALAWRDSTVWALTFGHREAHQAVNHLGKLVDVSSVSSADAFAKRLIKQLQAFTRDPFHGDFHDVSLRMNDLTPFARRVLTRCRAIPAGQTMTYGELAAAVGSPRAARAVGRVMARNPFPLIVPCHRVIGADGRLCGFSAPHGLTMKRRLLRAEDVTI